MHSLGHLVEAKQRRRADDDLTLLKSLGTGVLDLSVGIALGSSIQIALFVAPVLVFASYFIAPRPLELSFGRAEVGSLFLGVLTGTIVSGDGQSNWFKGVQLVTVYAIIALMFYFLPELKH